MTDIVERLREGRTDGTALRWTVTDIHREAADEIERLRAERDMWRDENVKKQTACEQMGARIVALEAERDAARAEAARLRETLTWVLNDVQAWCDAIAENGAGWDYWDDYYKSFHWGGIEKARAALAAKEPGHD